MTRLALTFVLAASLLLPSRIGLGQTQADAPAAPGIDDPAEPPTALDLAHLEYTLDGIELFRSSAFYNPRTPFGAQAYHAIDDHYAARVFGAFSWEISQSSDLESFQQRLERHRAGVEWLVQKHEKLIISINYMPGWLSRSESQRLVEGFYEERNTHGPRDWDAWSAVVGAIVRFYGQFDGAQMYYEIWNEPDIHYWQEDIDAYLKLYEKTAAAIRAADPRAKVGGAAVSSWRGRVKRSPDRDPLTLELIRFARQHELPLDFISWHDFTGSTSSIKAAVDAYRSALKAAGYEPEPELVVSEWNVGEGVRGTPYQAAMMADLMVAFRQYGVDVQTVAAWENWHPDPDPGAYGLITQGGLLTPAYELHGAFHGLAQDSTGLATVFSTSIHAHEGGRRILVSRKAEHRFQLAVWEIGFDPPTAAAVQQLLDAGLNQEDLARYGGVPGLTAAIETGRARDPRHRELLRAAQATFLRHAVRRRPVRLEFPGWARVQVDSAVAIKSDRHDVPVIVEGNRLTIDLEKYQVLLLDIHVEAASGSQAGAGDDDDE